MTLSLDGPLLLVGAGKMGGALLEGWLKRGLDPRRITVQDPAPPADIMAVLERHGSGWCRPWRRVARAGGDPDGGEAAGDGDRLSAGRQAGRCRYAGAVDRRRTHDRQFRAASGSRPRRRPGHAEYAGRHWPRHHGLLRQSALQCGAEGAGRRVAAAVGEVDWVGDERLIDAVTAVSGSGPAYVFLLAECLAEAGRAVGLDAGLARKLADATVSGSGELLRQSGLDPAILRKNVTSPGGTTAAALEVLMGADGCSS